VVAVVEIALGVTEREQAEEHLAAAARQWRQTFDAMSDSIALFDKEGRVLRCYAATTALTGRPFEDIVGRPCCEVFHGARLRVTFQPLTDEAGRVSGGVHVVSDVSDLKQAERGLLESLAARQAITEGVIAALARTVEVRDADTGGHQRRVSRPAAAMARRMGLAEERAEGPRVAGLLHDVGMVDIPAEILAKPGLLTTIELEPIKAHAQAGFEISAAIHFPWPVAEMALQHHERRDGSGYPAGLSGEDVLPEARILAVADVVEAMVGHRPHRPSLGLEAALAEVRAGAGVCYDPAAVAACQQVFAEGFVCTEA